MAAPLFELVIILLVTKIAGDISVRLGQPAVLGKLLSGILIGPALLGWVHHSEMIEQFSEIGVLLLMFLAGLETDLKELNESRRSSVATALGGLLLPLAGGYAAGLLFGMPRYHALFLGFLLAATSVSISVQTLRELGQLKSPESTTILGAALVDDILVVVSLAVVMGFITDADVSVSSVILKKLAFFAIVIVLGWKGVPWVMNRLANLKVTEPISSTGLILCFLFAYIAEWLGVAGIIGAFAAGLAISRTEFKHKMEHKIESIAYVLFVPVFFASIGLSVSFEGVLGNLWLIIVLTLVAIATKWFGGGIGARLTGFDTKSALRIGAGMVSRGEVALILALLGLESQLLAPEYYTSILIVVILTTIVTPPMLKILFRR